ncbi:MAG: hypothetical protein LBH97_00785 [Treponema sp.]|jgi:hypothetical protein|nr:hypothetical protein [Treponema sp.]
MTLPGRNVIFRVGILLAALCLLAIIAASFIVVPVYSVMETENTRRSDGFFQAIIIPFLGNNLFAVHAAIIASAMYALFSIILTYSFFEKTQSPEILFIVFFVSSFALEAVRLLLPLSYVYEIPSLYLLMAFRILLFGRCFGIFSLFIASVYAAGFNVQKQRTVLLVIAGATLIITLGVPIDTQTWDSTLNTISGHTSLFRLIEAGTFFITIISFFIAAWSRGTTEYTRIGLGTVLVYVGRNLLIFGDTWAGPVVGLPLLAAGTWLICTQLHKIYLWL